MDTKQKQIAAVAVVVIIIIAAVAVYFATKDKDNGGDDEGSTVTFLIQDNYGVYFWVEGQGETVYDAFKDAVSDYSMPFEASTDSSGVETGIQSLFGLAMTETSSGWLWWTQYSYTDGAWSTNYSYMTGLAASENPYVAVVYGDGTVTPTVTPSDAEVWDKDTDGIVFTVQSPSGMYFKINGNGSDAMSAWEVAYVNYNIDSEAEEVSGGAWITSIFTLDTPSDYSSYWAVYVVENGTWTYATSYLTGMTPSEYSSILLVYTVNGETPELPPVA
ncbi:MAG: hypothetical protein Q4Q58_05360 [Thermoplasmata archaeon]|nr:hypothetical protein [Thermoplasmata archaeon]